ESKSQHTESQRPSRTCAGRSGRVAYVLGHPTGVARAAANRSHSDCDREAGNDRQWVDAMMRQRMQVVLHGDGPVVEQYRITASKSWLCGGSAERSRRTAQ